MSVRAKFICKSITREKHWDANKGEIHTMEFYPVSSGSEENKKFFEATPSGHIKLGVVNENAGKYFELGQAYYLDFTKAE